MDTAQTPGIGDLDSDINEATLDEELVRRISDGVS